MHVLYFHKAVSFLCLFLWYITVFSVHQFSVFCCYVLRVHINNEHHKIHTSVTIYWDDDHYYSVAVRIVVDIAKWGSVGCHGCMLAGWHTRRTWCPQTSQWTVCESPSLFHSRTWTEHFMVTQIDLHCTYFACGKCVYVGEGRFHSEGKIL